MAKNKGGRPAHQPTDALRKQVETMAGFGVTAIDIGRSIGISEVTLRKHYRDELDLGSVKANAAVAQSLFRKATGDGSQAVTAAIFWAKTRMGWVEPASSEAPGKKAQRQTAAESIGGRYAAPAPPKLVVSNK